MLGKYLDLVRAPVFDDIALILRAGDAVGALPGQRGAVREAQRVRRQGHRNSADSEIRRDSGSERAAGPRSEHRRDLDV